MKKIWILLSLLLLLCGCGRQQQYADIAATTLPVYDFTQSLCAGTGLTVTRLVTEQVSCLHDYALKVDQVKAAEAAQLVVISGAGLEDFLDGVIDEKKTLDASVGIALLCGEHDEEEEAAHEAHTGHHHESDPHIWLNPRNAKQMATNIAAGLSKKYPTYAEIFANNLTALLAQLDTLDAYGDATLSQLRTRQLITFHDGFTYLADRYALEILRAMEEEAGSEASAKDLISLITLVREHQLPAVFTEVSGSAPAAQVIAAETGCSVFALDMAMAGESYFSAMYHNIDTLKEALG